MLYTKIYRQKHIREDGWLSELISMNYDDDPFNCVHTYVVSVKPGKSRANHYHKIKKEWVSLASGKIELVLKDVKSGELEKVFLSTDSNNHEIIYVPPYIAHAVKNIGDAEATLIVFSKNPEDKEDTIPFEVA